MAGAILFFPLHTGFPFLLCPFVLCFNMSNFMKESEHCVISAGEFRKIFGYFFHIGSFHLPNGMIMLPLIAGIGMLFLMDRKIFGWIVLSIGIVIVLLSVLLTTRLHWRSTSAYVFVIMFGMVAAGAGMVLKELFRKR